MFDKSKTIDKKNADTTLEVNSYGFWIFPPQNTDSIFSWQFQLEFSKIGSSLLFTDVYDKLLVDNSYTI